MENQNPNPQSEDQKKLQPDHMTPIESEKTESQSPNIEPVQGKESGDTKQDMTSDVSMSHSEDATSAKTEESTTPDTASSEEKQIINEKPAISVEEKKSHEDDASKAAAILSKVQDAKATSASTAGKKKGFSLNLPKGVEATLMGVTGGLSIVVTFLVLNFNANPEMFANLGFDATTTVGILRFLTHFFFGAFTLIVLLLLIRNAFIFLFHKEKEEAQNHVLIGLVLTPILLIIGATGWFLMPQFIYNPQVEEEPQTVVEEVKYTSPQITALARDEQTDTLRRLTNTAGLTAPLQVQFDSSLLIPQETDFYRIIGYAWDVNGDNVFDSSEGTSATASYTYEEKGIYDVSLKTKKQVLRPFQNYKAGDIIEEVYGPGSDRGGLSLAISKVRPTINVTTNPTELRGVTPFKVAFDASGSIDDTGITSIEWDFDDNGSIDAEGAKIEHTFERAGFQIVRLIVTDSEGLASVKRFEVDVNEPTTPSAKILATPLSGDAPLKVKFDAANSTSPDGRIVSYLWDFGDSSSKERGQVVEHTYTRAGKYTVTLTVETDIGTTGTGTEVIDVSTPRSAPTARIRASRGGNLVEGEVTGKAPLEIEWDGSFSTDPENDIIRWEWDFNGDKNFDAEGAESAYTYSAPGKYLVTLRLTDSAGNSSVATRNVTVTADELIVVIDADPITGEAPLWVAFDGAGSNYILGDIVSYSWDFGDGTPPQLTGAAVSHQYTAPGSYIVTLTVQTEDGKTQQGKKVISVLQESLVPAFDVTPSTGEAPLEVTFDATNSKGKIISYRWDFGDGNTANGQEVVYNFLKKGIYTVTLRVQDTFGNVMMTKKTITVD